MSEHYLLLKWGTLKGWNVPDGECFDLLKKWNELGVSMSAMTQKNTPEQIDVLCQLVEKFDGEIHNDWDGEKYTKEQAVKYLREYNA